MIADKHSVLEMAMGAIAEMTDYEVNRIIANIMDPMTAPTDKRKLTLTLTFTPDESRSTIVMDVKARTAIAPLNGVRTMMGITKTRDGELIMAEMMPQVPGQIDMDGDEAPAPALARMKY